mgnify:FL=1
MSLAGRSGSFFSPGVARLYGERLPPDAVALIKAAADATDRQYLDVGGGLSHGLQVYRLALGLGVDGRVAQQCGILLDGLQIAVDMADNLADAVLDVEQGRSYQRFYDPIHPDARPALPALMTGCVVDALYRWFPSPAHDSTRASLRLLQILGLMTGGQGLGRDDPLRIDRISGEQGRIYALPLWLSTDRSFQAEGRLTAVEGWGFELGRTWQLQREVVEDPGDPRWPALLEQARAQTRAAWPDFPPFVDRGLFTQSALGFGAHRG